MSDFRHFLLVRRCNLLVCEQQELTVAVSGVKRNFRLAKSLTLHHLLMPRVVLQIMYFASGGTDD